jgi:hypothetical protein
MFVVNVVDGRLGQFTLSPVVVFPQSPKYISPQPNRPRSGVASTVGSGGWPLGEDEVLAVNVFTPPGMLPEYLPLISYSSTSRLIILHPPGEPMYGYSVNFFFDADANQYQYRDPLTRSYGLTSPAASSYSAYAFAHLAQSTLAHDQHGPERGPGKGFRTQSGYGPGYGAGYSDASQRGAAGYHAAAGYADGGRVAIRGSSWHEFCRCEGGFLLCHNLGQPTLLFPDPAAMTPIFSWFKASKIPSEVVRRLMENYQSAVAGGLPRTFLLFSALPFTDKVNALHFHGAEALLSVSTHTHNAYTYNTIYR